MGNDYLLDQALNEALKASSKKIEHPEIEALRKDLAASQSINESLELVNETLNKQFKDARGLLWRAVDEREELKAQLDEANAKIKKWEEHFTKQEIEAAEAIAENFLLKVKVGGLENQLDEANKKLRWRKWPDEKPDLQGDYLVKVAAENVPESLGVFCFEIYVWLPSCQKWIGRNKVFEWLPPPTSDDAVPPTQEDM
jgi:predicted nuclease with TOPRIM domain